MGTEVVRPQDCLVERIRVPPCRRRNYYYGNGNFSNPDVYSTGNYHTNINPRFNKKPTAVRLESSGQRKKQPAPSISRKSGTADDLKIPRNNRVMEKVTVLRRGESLESSLKKGHGNCGDFVVASTARLGPGPKMFSKQIRNPRCPVNGKCDVYAGSAFAVSPAPSSLPLPSFSKKKQVSTDDAATRDLRRLLGLEF
ncbi:hypothetical protein SADUNF_Sadunf10G0013800 [Salix dunnii]|uniref:Uncharacterized protein n=1 Tax=Salix dunnii TaxID=1413687 RepID=A0A835MPV0_9ROSI|nr:hypothetical protein SADUNF_Sadunf10G0013800 [Salix dunnii]